MTRKEIITFLKERGVEFNPTLKLADLEALYALHNGENKQDGIAKTDTPENPKTMTDSEKLLEMMGGVMNKLESMESRIKKVEGINPNDFKNNVKQEDVEKASKQKELVDEKLVKIVEEILGVDFGIEMETYDDRPGFLFTVIVPKRLSDTPKSTRPVIDPETGFYKTQSDGKTPVLEDYIPEDRRSRAIGSTQSYDAVRDHCNKVRSYLVSYYQKMSKPLPELKTKN